MCSLVCLTLKKVQYKRQNINSRHDIRHKESMKQTIPVVAYLWITDWMKDWPRAFHNTQVARDFPKRCRQFLKKLLKKCLLLLLLLSSFICFDAKVCKLYNKSKISKHFLCNYAALVTSVAKFLCPQLNHKIFEKRLCINININLVKSQPETLESVNCKPLSIILNFLFKKGGLPGCTHFTWN